MIVNGKVFQAGHIKILSFFAFTPSNKKKLNLAGLFEKPLLKPIILSSNICSSFRMKYSICCGICTCFKAIPSFLTLFRIKIYFVRPKKDTEIIKFPWLRSFEWKFRHFFSFTRNGLLKKLKLLFLIVLLPDFIVHSFGPRSIYFRRKLRYK